MLTLFEIAGEISALHDLLVECGGELTDAEAEAAIDEWLAETNATVERKLNGVGWLIREFEARAEAREIEAKRLMALAGTDSNGAKRIKQRAKLFLETSGLAKVETEHFKFAIAANGGALPLIVPPAWERDAAEAPERYHKISVSLNRTLISEDLKSGEEVNGCSFGERGTHLRIK